MHRVASIVALAVLVFGAAAATQQGRPASGLLALVNASVLDVRDGRVARSTVVVRGPRIESIGGAPAPFGAAIIDVAGRYLVPGLIDSHVHIGTMRALPTALESGVTTLRSSGVSSYVDVGMRELVRRGAVVGPEVLASGYHVRPQLAEEAFLSSPDLAPLMGPRGVTGAAAIRQVVRENLSRGVNWIKVLATERARLPDTDPRKQCTRRQRCARRSRPRRRRGSPSRRTRTATRGRWPPSVRACAASSTARTSPTRRCG